MTPEAIAKLIAEINASQPKGAPPFSWKSIPKVRQLRCGPPVSPMLRRLADAIAKTARREVVTVPGVRRGVRPYALDPQRAQALWQKSEEMVGERF